MNHSNPAAKPLQYYPNATILHSFHPMVKLVWLVAMSVILIMNRDTRLTLLLLVSILFLFPIGKIRLLEIKGFKPIVWTTLFIAVLQLIFIQNGTRLFQIGRYSITNAGLDQAAYASSRFLGIVLAGFILVLTTDPNKLVFALMQAGMPYRFGYALITALRLLSILSSEIEKIYYASLIKGIAYKPFPVKKLIQNLTRFFQLVFLAIFSKIDALSFSMEGRGFGVGKERTFLTRSKFRPLDIGVILFMILLFFLFLFENFRLR